MTFTFKKMKQEDAHQIASWHYAAPYDFYDWDRDPEDLAELLDPQSWQPGTLFSRGVELERGNLQQTSYSPLRARRLHTSQHVYASHQWRRV